MLLKRLIISAQNTVANLIVLLRWTNPRILDISAINTRAHSGVRECTGDHA